MRNVTVPKHMRIAALQCDFEGGEKGTFAVPALWEDFGFNVEQLFHTHAEMYSAVFEKDKHAGKLRRYLDDAKARGIDVILYMNCHILLGSQSPMYSQWAQKTRNGEYALLYETYKGCCLNSSWLDYFLGALDGLKGLPLMGVFFDGPSGAACFCERCDKKFRTIYGKALSDAAESEIAAFALRSRIDAKKRLYDKVKEVNPSWIAYYNEGVLHSRASLEEYRETLAGNDLVGTEGGFQFYGPPRQIEIWRCGISAKAAEAVSEGKPTVIFMAGDHKPWSWYLHTPAETRLCYASTIANGASVWYGIHSSTALLKGETGAAAKEMVRFDKSLNGVLKNTESLAETAIFYSFDTAKNYASTGETTDLYDSGDIKSASHIGNYNQSFQGAAAALFRAAIPFDVLTEIDLGDINRYRAIVLPTAACLREETADWFRRFVENGGTLIADSETSLYDQNGAKRGDFLLADLFGASVKGYRRYKTHDYFECANGFSVTDDASVRFLPAPLAALVVAPRPGAEEIARLFPPIPGRYAGRPETSDCPFIVRNRFGKGRAYYLAGTFFELYLSFGICHYKTLLEKLVRGAGVGAFVLENAPESVEFTVRRDRDSGKTLLFLVNYEGGMTRPINRVAPLSGLTIRSAKPVRSARAARAGKKLVINDGREVRLPKIGEYEVIVLEMA